MDVTAFVTSAAIMTAQSSVQQSVDVSLLKKTMDTAENNSNELIQAMQRSLQPHIGSKLDLKG